MNSPPPSPANLWERAELRDALAEQDFGRLLRAYRLAHEPVVTQAQLGAWLGLTQGQVSRIERGRAFTYPLSKLSRWAVVMGVPQHALWFQLEGDDARRREFVRSTGTGAPDVGRSLLASGAVVGTAASGRHPTVRSPEVALLRELTGAFRRVDNRYGGGHSRSAVDTYLKTMVQPLLAGGKARSTVRGELFAAAAELHQLAGWMAYDTGQARAGRQHLRTALRLCQESGDQALSAEILAAMSHQAAFHGVPESAVDLALAARQTARRTGVSVLRAEAAVMEAHGLALLCDKHACLAALHDAENMFGAASENEVPDWLRYFDAAYLSAKFAHTFRDLGQPRDAEGFARRSLEMSDGYERGRLFNTALLASILADLGEVDEACALGLTATGMVDDVRSVRSMAYLADVAQRLCRHDKHAEVRALFARMVDAGIPVPTAS